MKKFNIGKEFSIDPSGRFYTDGKGSGEEFREEFLKPKLFELSENEVLQLLLDEGVTSYGSSFLVEGFAGIVKYGYMTAKDLLNKLNFIYTDPDFEFYKDRIVSYINEASFNSKTYIKTK